MGPAVLLGGQLASGKQSSTRMDTVQSTVRGLGTGPLAASIWSWTHDAKEEYWSWGSGAEQAG